MHDGATVEIESHGDGPAVLMHPLPRYDPDDQAELALKERLDPALVEQLSDRYRLIMFEYPGDPKPQTLTVENVTADLLAIADAAGADQFAWCGYSWTGIVGLHLAFASGRLTALICGGWPPVGGPYDRMLEIVSTPLDIPSGSHTARTMQQFKTFYEPLQGFDDETPQSRITCPRLCVASAADNIYDTGVGPTIVSERERLERLGWDVELVDGLEHMAVLEPDVFIPIICSWLDRVPFHTKSPRTDGRTVESRSDSSRASKEQQLGRAPRR
jgi:pimeloyl-ACP methyl ester carboxylesterase